MLTPLPPIGSAVSTAGAPAVSPLALPNAEKSASGVNPFEKLLISTNQDQLNSDQAIADLATGKTDNVQQVVMQVVKAEMSFQLFMELRNQMVESYNELMRMQF